jgi:hypothetical protein
LLLLGAVLGLRSLLWLPAAGRRCSCVLHDGSCVHNSISSVACIIPGHELNWGLLGGHRHRHLLLLLLLLLWLAQQLLQRQLSTNTLQPLARLRV